MNIGIEVANLDFVQKKIEEYKRDIHDKCDMFVRKLAENGVEIARLKIENFDAIDTGELYASLYEEKGEVVTNGSTWYVKTNCEWAKYVEFGTGIIGDRNPHPNPSIVGWEYDIHDHGELGWWYYKNGKWHCTSGFQSRPFMYETAMELPNIVVKVAKEVFG